MVVDHWRDIVSWCFEYPLPNDEEKLSFAIDRRGFIPMTGKIYQALKILEKYRLLFNIFDINKEEKIRSYIRMDSFKNFVEDIKQFKSYTLSSGKIECGFLEGGEGIIFSQTGDAIVYENVVTVQTTSLPLAVFIRLHSTDFLPYTLDGYPQKEVYKYNAPRLEQAMQEIEACLGLPPLMDEIDYSDYCLIKGYRLMNLYQEEIDDGRIMVLGLNEAGHVLPEAEMTKIEVDPNYVEEFGKP